MPGNTMGASRLEGVFQVFETRVGGYFILERIDRLKGSDEIFRTRYF